MTKTSGTHGKNHCSYLQEVNDQNPIRDPVIDCLLSETLRPNMSGWSRDKHQEIVDLQNHETGEEAVDERRR